MEQHIPFPPKFIDAPALSAPPVITHPLPTIEAPPHVIRAVRLKEIAGLSEKIFVKRLVKFGIIAHAVG